MTVTRMTFSSGPARRQPRIGDRRWTKRHGLQVRVVETHGGRWVCSGGRYRHEWRTLAELAGTQWDHLVPYPRNWKAAA